MPAYDVAVENHTPHEVVLLSGARQITIGPTLPFPRRAVTRSTHKQISVQGVPVPISVTELGPPIDLPPRRADTLLIVPRVVAEHCPGRDDLVFPDRLIRDDHGRVVACLALARVRTVEREAAQADGTFGPSVTQRGGDEHG